MVDNSSDNDISVKYDPDRGVYRSHHDWGRVMPVYLTVLEAYAAIEEAETPELPFLSEYVDPTALDELFRRREGEDPNESISVTFPFGDFEVTVHGTGEIVFSPVT